MNSRRTALATWLALASVLLASSLAEMLSAAEPSRPAAPAASAASSPSEMRRRATLDFHQRAQERPGVLVPLYVYPGDVSNNPAYQRLIELKRDYPTVPTWVIVNPASGPGERRDENYAQAVRRLRGAGCVLLGYVPTTYGRRPADEVRRDIDRWLNLYPGIHGIFFDEMAYEDKPAAAAHQQSLHRYAHSVGCWPTVGNPGADAPDQYFSEPAADVIVVHEGNAWPTAERWRKSKVYADHPPHTRGILLHSTPQFDPQELRRATHYARWFYVTEAPYRAGDPAAANPWDRLSKHLEELYRELSRR